MLQWPRSFPSSQLHLDQAGDGGMGWTFREELLERGQIKPSLLVILRENRDTGRQDKKPQTPRVVVSTHKRQWQSCDILK